MFENWGKKKTVNKVGKLIRLTGIPVLEAFLN